MKKIFNLVNKVVSKGNFITLHSFTDITDNSLPMYTFLKKNKKIMKENYKFIWLIQNDKKIDQYKKILNTYGINNFEDTLFLKRISLKGFLYFMKSKYIFCTHGLNSFIDLTKEQTAINLWHGMPLKNIGILDGKEGKSIYKSNLNIATSELFKDIIDKSFNAKKTIISGQPRNDLFFIDSKFDKQLKQEKNIVWMPTYRKSKVGDIREDGKVNNLTKEILGGNKLYEINNFLKAEGYNLIIKPHPMDSIEIADNNISNIKIIYNENLEEQGINLYTILKNSEALITDYSSVYIDYLILNKPIGFLIDDMNDYGGGRGFVFENPLEYMPGEKIQQFDHFFDFIKNVVNKNDNYENERLEVNKKFNEINECKSCEIILKEVGLI